MIYLFDTLDFGRVEIDTNKAEAYFFVRDECYAIDNDGEFTDFNGLKFYFCKPITVSKNQDATLSVQEWKTIARDTRTSGRPGVRGCEKSEETSGGNRGGACEESPSGPPKPPWE